MALCAPVEPARAEELVCGTISANTTWVSSTVYVIDCKVVISVGVTLTLQAGVVVKFKSQTHLEIKGNLLSQGTALNRVVFTALEDDLHGGDTNGDGSATTPSPGSWNGIHLLNSAAALQYSIVLYATNGVNVGDGISSDISHNVFRHNQAGINVANALPAIHHNDFEANTSYAILKMSPPLVSAEDNYWGAPTGPYHPLSNPHGEGDPVSDYVDFQPYLLMTADKPVRSQVYLPQLQVALP